MRGEKITSLRTSLSMLGSPPHARGEVQRGNLEALELGITPAYAGKSEKMQPGNMDYKDHPRMREEKPQNRQECKKKQGSPPHARGKERAEAPVTNTPGITPACAGKSSSRQGPRWSFGDHPRMRGEKGMPASTQAVT